jgi:class 3 adenylate cyclase
MHQETQGVALVLDDVTENKRLEIVRRYLPPALVDQVRDIDAVQKPQRRQISIVFADIRGFTTISEQWDPELIIQVLNNHLTVAAAAISHQEGMIDKYDGDTVMALFNSPLNPQVDHALRAVRTALAIQNDLAEYHRHNPDDLHLQFGIGVHSGDAVVGNVGSPLRKDYSAIGDAVNLSKRLQELAEGGQILITQSTYDQVLDLVSVTSLDEVQVKGRQAINQIYQLDGMK